MTYNVIVSGDIETIPGPGLRSHNKIPRCKVSWKGVGANSKCFECEKCFNLNHIMCKNISKTQLKQYTAKSVYKWTCYDCTFLLLPFYKQRDVESVFKNGDLFDTHKNNLLNNKTSSKFYWKFDENRHFLSTNLRNKIKIRIVKKFYFLVHNISCKWNGLLMITGDFNIDF